LEIYSSQNSLKYLVNVPELLAHVEQLVQFFSRQVVRDALVVQNEIAEVCPVIHTRIASGCTIA